MFLDIARAKEGRRGGMQNAGWCYDNYPELSPLDAGARIELASFEGPGTITCIHITQHLVHSERLHWASSRGLILEVFYNGQTTPAVRCPLADFFADGCNGQAKYFSTPFVEKLPESYNCYIPMPFEQSVRITLHNETPYDCGCYAFVEYQQLPHWDENLMYFHCTWQRDKFQLTPTTVRPMVHIEGDGHYIGKHYSIATNERLFREFYFVQEGNCETRLDGEKSPSYDYLGTEDSFGFSWGFRKEFCGLHSGINYLQLEKLPFQLSIYRFRDQNPIIFKRSFDLQINWQHEGTSGKRHYDSEDRMRIQRVAEKDGCWIDYATTHHWYQRSVGFEHYPMMPYKQRTSEVL